MISTKMVDILVETIFYTNGINLYEDGSHVGYSNLLHYCGPSFCGQTRWWDVQESFVDMVRTKSSDAVNVFYSALDTATKACTHQPFAEEMLSLLAMSRDVISPLLQWWNQTELDPAVTSFIALSSSWSVDYPEGYVVLHDDSKPMAYDEDVIRALMDPPPQHMLSLPVFMTAIDFQLVDSSCHPQIQIADILASSCVYWA